MPRHRGLPAMCSSRRELLRLHVRRMYVAGQRVRRRSDSERFFVRAQDIALLVDSAFLHDIL